MKRTAIMILLMATVLCLTVFSAGATEEPPLSGSCGENVTWEYDPDNLTLTIRGTGDMENYGIEVCPAMADDGEVTKQALTSNEEAEPSTVIDGSIFGPSAPWREYAYSCEMKSVVIEEGVTSIGSGAFFECFAMQSVSIPNTVTVIGGYALKGCSGLTQVQLPNALKEINQEDFWGCDSLTEIMIPQGVNQIVVGAFSSCDRLEAIRVAEGNPYFTNDVKGVLFNKEKTSLLQCPAGMEGTYCVPDTVKIIRGEAFYGCRRLSEVLLPEELTDIGAYAFAWSGIKTISLPNSLEKVNFYAFRGCLIEKMTVWNPICDIDYDDFTLGDSVKLYGYPGSTAEQYARCHDDATFIGHIYENGECVICAEGYSDGGACGENLRWSVALEDDSWVLRIEGKGVPMSDNFGRYGWTPYASVVDVIVMEEGVTGTGEVAFMEFRELTEVSIPSTLTTIGNGAFCGSCALTRIELPSNVTTVEEGAFSYCDRLEKITVWNPGCDIFAEKRTLGHPDTTVIRGVWGSTAERYAAAFGYLFEGTAESANDGVANFTDCPDKWYRDAVDFVVRNGLMKGVDDGKFDPNGALSRAMVVTVLYRIAGTPDTVTEIPFADVPYGAWYTKAVAWAREKGIVLGVTATEFAPMENMSREQIATVLWRSVGSPVVQADLTGYPDGDRIGRYATKAMRWAVTEGILRGDELGCLRPDAHATRAEFACMIQRFMEKQG